MSWLFFFMGLSIGLGTYAFLDALYKSTLVLKANDGTAEYIGGKVYYIITNEDWKLLEAWRLPMLRGEGAAVYRESTWSLRRKIKDLEVEIARYESGRVVMTAEIERLRKAPPVVTCISCNTTFEVQS